MVVLRGLIISLALIGGIAKADIQWRIPDKNNLVMMTLPQGKVVVELAPEFAPKHVKQFKNLVKKQHYDGNKFYRVIDGFVAQAGPKDGSAKDRGVPLLALEGEWGFKKDWPFTLVQTGDLFAEKTGFVNGFSVGISVSEKKSWLTHCPGVIAMARGNNKNSGSSHFYIPNGQAPRYLDRLMTIFGRVIYGMEHVQSITRTAVIEGQAPITADKYTPIVRMQMMSDIPKDQQITLAVERTDSPEFLARLVKRKERKNPFFFKAPPQVLDVCQVPIRSKLMNE